MRFGFYSCMSGMPWGGSEELWWRAARRLQEYGHSIFVNYKWWPETARQLRDIENGGGQLHLRNQPARFWRKQLARASWSSTRNGSAKNWLKQAQPDAVLITIGYHPDRVEVARDCADMAIPYAINVQCASNFFFIHGDALDHYRHWYQNASRVFFVSRENQHKLETNLATSLTNAEIVANPFNVDHQTSCPWPSTQPKFKLACVGRIHFQSKGQDLIIDVLKQEKWKNRPLEITFYGSDQGNERQLRELIQMYGLADQLRLVGFVDNVNRIWEDNHALLLPSRYEGAPLCVVEAMLCNRMCITTDIGRNAELIDDGQSGFIAASATAASLDDALERAWQCRDRWEAIGQLAGQHVRHRHSIDPIGDFADRLLELASSHGGPKGG